MKKVTATAALAGVVLFFAASCGTSRPAKDPIEESGDPGTTEVASDGEEAAAPAKADVEVTETGFTSYAGYEDAPRGNAAAVLVNRGSKSAVFFEVVFTFRDVAGSPVGTESSYVWALDPGGTGYAQVDSVQLRGEAASVEASAVVDDDSFMTNTGVVIPVTVDAVAPETRSGTTVAGTATNPTAEAIKSGNVTCIFRSGGMIVGGANTSLDTIFPSGSVAWDISSIFDQIAFDAAECSAASY